MSSSAAAQVPPRSDIDGSAGEERWSTIGTDPIGTEGHTARTRAVRAWTMKKEYDFSKGKRGPVVRVPAGKTRVTIRLDDDVLEWFREQIDRAGGGNYQTLINQALHEFISRTNEPLESTLRRVIRQELRRAG